MFLVQFLGPVRLTSSITRTDRIPSYSEARKQRFSHRRPLRLGHDPTNKSMLRNNQHRAILALNRRPHSSKLPPHPEDLALDPHRLARGRGAQERQGEGARDAEVGPGRVGDVAEGECGEEVEEGGCGAAGEAGEGVAVGGLDRVEEGCARGWGRGGGVVGYVADEVGVVGLAGFVLLVRLGREDKREKNEVVPLGSGRRRRRGRYACRATF